ncbi:MAG: hypothetical protein E7206_26605 [Clostridium beijerinckii]|nr:hypothetical protein [Clostridium beijerinckii]
MKKKIIILVSVMMTIFFIGCDKQISISSKNGEFTGTYENGTPEDFNREPDISELKFFEDISEAILANNFSEDLSAINVKKIIKILEKDDDCIVFFVTQEVDKDMFYIYKMKEKSENNKKYYSTPILAGGWQWEDKKNWSKQLESSTDESEWFSEKVESDLMLFNGSDVFTLGNDKIKIKWGLSIDENIKKLKINGVSPTEIMNIKLDDDDVYFWYYEGLDVNHSNISETKITF